MRCAVLSEAGRPFARVWLADTFLLRLRGLLGRELSLDGGLLLMPCRQIHTFFMAYPIDAVYLDRQGRVLRVDAGIRPWRTCPAAKGCWAVLELPVYKTAAEGIALGQQITSNILEDRRRRTRMKRDQAPQLDGSLTQLRQKLDQARFGKALFGYSRQPVLAYIAELREAASYEQEDHQQAVLALQRNIALANDDVLAADSRAKAAEEQAQQALAEMQALRQGQETQASLKGELEQLQALKKELEDMQALQQRLAEQTAALEAGETRLAELAAALRGRDQRLAEQATELKDKAMQLEQLQVEVNALREHREARLMEEQDKDQQLLKLLQDITAGRF